jgi:two-component system response regulator HupR/HoxA
LLPVEVQELRHPRTETKPGTLREELERVEARVIAEALNDVRWNRSEAARQLRISYPNLLAKIKRYHLSPPTMLRSQ